MEYIPRWLESVLLRSLRQLPVLVVTGARQTGKSTLVQHFPGAAARRYLTLDDLEDLDLAKRAPAAFLESVEPLTVDEVQRAPSLLLAVKRDVDQRRRRGRFLLTGSANLLLMKTISETLAGRAQYLTLWPLTEAERRRFGPPATWSSLFAARNAAAALRAIAPAAAAKPPLDEVILRGGYPPVLDLSDDEARRLWFDGYVRTYLERDLQQFAQIDALTDFRRLMRVAALRAGRLLNQAELARDAGLAPATTHRYLNLLEISYQLYRLPAYAVNRTKRLIKSPKLYWTDTGLACFVAGIGRDELAADRGALVENLLLSNLLAWREVETPRPELTYWRTAAGEEVDFVIEWQNRLLPIEVKATPRVGAADVRALEGFLTEYAGVARFGVVVFTGSEPRLVSDRILALPFSSATT